MKTWGQSQAIHSRSHLYHKNDNRFTEENSNFHIRAYVGGVRYDARLRPFILKRRALLGNIFF